MRTKKKQLNRSTLNKVSTGIIAGVMAFAISSAAVQYIDLDPWMMFSYFRIFITVIFVMPLSILIFRNWKTFLGTVGAAAVIVLIFAIIWMKNGIPEDLSISAVNYFTWLWEFITQWQTNMELSWSYSYMTTVGVSALITVMMYFLLVKWYAYLPVFILSVSLFVAQWAVVREVNKFAFYLTLASLVLLYFLQIYLDRVRLVTKKEESHGFLTPGRFIMTSLPLVLVLLMIVMVVPKSPEPIKWKWLDDKIKYRNVGGDKPVDFKVYEQFSLANTGFSSAPGTPGGSVELDFSHILDVYSSEITYLRGESWPYFNGKSWGTTSIDMNFAEPILEYSEYNAGRRMLLEPVYGWRFIRLNEWLNTELEGYTGSRILPGPDFDSIMGDHLLPPWFTRKKVDIVYAGVESNTLFAPMYSSLNSFNGLKGVKAETDDTLETESTISLFSFIHYDYLSMDKDNERLLETLRKSRHGLYYQTYTNLHYIASNEDAYENVYVSNSMSVTLQDLYELYARAEDYYWRYTQVNKTLPPRVKTLAREITEPFSNDYDKVKAIEDYLHEGFTYNLQVEDVPSDRDFVDWFLFDSKDGYCTYYATSMVTLVRSIGLPARYIEGFLTPAGPQAESRYPVLNSNAHAWVEVYFEGVGWVRFEPTPPFAGIFDESADRTPNPEFDPGDELDEHLDELDKEDQTGVPGIGGDSGGRSGSISTIWLVIIIAGASLVALNISVQAGRKMLFKNVSNRKRFKLCYFEILRIVGFRGIRLKKSMTLRELAVKIDDSYYSPRVSMEMLTDIYYKIIYSDDDISDDELALVGIFYEDFRIEFNNELKLWEWLVYRVLIPLI